MTTMKLLNQIEDLIPQASRRNDTVSKWSVGMQLEHTLIAVRGISRALIQSSPGSDKQQFHPVRALILLLGRIPRGRGKAPDSSLPAEATSESELRALLAEARQALKAAENSDPKSHWHHPRFGTMTRDTALDFLEVHTRHHLAIVRDILA